MRPWPHRGVVISMQIKPVAEVLAAEALGSPEINALAPNENNYTVLLMQPRGQIEASAVGIRNSDRALAQRQFCRLLADAQQSEADLVITPEYSMPWDTLVAAIKAGVVPGEGKLWALGCESIKYSDLAVLKQDLAQFATVLYEPLPAELQRFTDPLAYVFVAPPAEGGGAPKLVVLVQFKTCPMGGDVDHFETNGLQLGNLVYQFGGGQYLRLISLICSDAFAFETENHAPTVYHQSLVIHIQLNPNPRHPQYRRYRDSLFSYAGDETEVICLNWAQDVEEWQPGKKAKTWGNIGGSAWYLRPNRFDVRDQTLVANHRLGLYYTWQEEIHAHALFFNYQPAVYHVTASKVAHIGVLAVKSYRRGPQLTRTCIWDDAQATWSTLVTADDGFSAVVGESGNAESEIKRIADDNPLAAERVLALCAGEIVNDEDWHSISRLDSCSINASEVIHRITFCQDRNDKAGKFRVARLKRCGNLWDILKTDGMLPAALADFKGGFRLEWVPASPHQNAVSLSATAQRATVIYMGEECSAAQIEATAKMVAEHLRRASHNDDESRSVRQRLAVFFGEHGEINLFAPNRYINFDQTDNASEVDIGREQ